MTRFTIFCLLLAASVARPADSPFVVEPYLQMGDAPSLASSDSLVIMWHAADADQAWDVETRKAGGEWSKPFAASSARVAVRGIEPHRVFRATVKNLTPGEEFFYRVRRAGQPVFETHARARKSREQPYRIAIFGDCAEGTPEQRAVAYQVYQSRPDYVFIPGDIVYGRGLISEYRVKFFPVYNAATASPNVGAPLIRSVLFTAAPGNHDTLRPNLTRTPDALAYFMYWSQPLNGPFSMPWSPNTPAVEGTDDEKAATLAAARESFPRMANFSFDYGNVHWLVLDSNPYVNWSDPKLRDWVASDLASAKSATWRFVGFHHPGFNSAHEHFTDQWMRALASTFEAGKVDIVFSGHVHNYQRSFPLRFRAAVSAADATGRFNGDWRLDKEFDGRSKTRPDGVIYLVTGAGGAQLYNPEQQSDPASWQPFTAKFISQVNSFTVVDGDGSRLSIRQVSKDGQELDRFTVTK